MFIDFSQLVKDEFSFLIFEYGFECVFSVDDFVRFESEEVFVSIIYDSNVSYEVGVEIGQLKVDDGKIPFNLMEVLQLEGVFGRKYNMLFQAICYASMAYVVSRLSFLLSTYAVGFLRNSQFDFDRLSDFRKIECKKYELGKKYLFIRREAQIAWRKKDYLKFIELYSYFKGTLSGLEKRKIDFAKKHVNCDLI